MFCLFLLCLSHPLLVSRSSILWQIWPFLSFLSASAITSFNILVLSEPSQASYDILRKFIPRRVCARPELHFSFQTHYLFQNSLPENSLSFSEFIACSEVIVCPELIT